MICAACGESTGTSPCTACGGDPLLEGRYRLESALGRGSGAVTWRATDLDAGRTVAIKESPLPLGGDKAAELAQREAQVLAQLDHPQIPRFVASIVAGRGKARSLYLVQEFVAGEDLRARMQTHRYAEAEVLDTLEALCPVLAYLHGLSPPVVHRDLKPANVIRRDDGSHALVDFGAVRDALRELGGSTVAGTFGYMAPEQFAGDATPRSDLYGLGALAVALLTRTDPANLAGHDRRLRWRHLASVTPATAALIDALLSADPTQRPASAPALAERIRKLRKAGRSRDAIGDPAAPTVEIPIVAAPSRARWFALGSALFGVATSGLFGFVALTAVGGWALLREAGPVPVPATSGAPLRWSLALPKGLPPAPVGQLFDQALNKLKEGDQRGSLERLYRVLDVQPSYPHGRKFAFAAGELLVIDHMTPVMRSRAAQAAFARQIDAHRPPAEAARLAALDTEIRDLRFAGRADDATQKLLFGLADLPEVPREVRARWRVELRESQREVARASRETWTEALRAELDGDSRTARTTFTELAARFPSNPSPAAHLERLVGEASHPIGAIEPTPSD